MCPTTAQQLWGPSASFLHHSEDVAEIKSFYSRAQESSRDFILKQVICKERSSVTEGEMAGAEHKMVTGILVLIKFCSFITFCIEYVCSNMALVAASVRSFFSILLYSFQIFPPMLKVKLEKNFPNFLQKNFSISNISSHLLFGSTGTTHARLRSSNCTKFKRAKSDADLKINKDFCATGAAELMQWSPARRCVLPAETSGSAWCFYWALQGCPSPACTHLGRAMPSKSSLVLFCSHSRWTACLPVSLQPITYIYKHSQTLIRSLKAKEFID